jgi:hypothetical protein
MSQVFGQTQIRRVQTPDEYSFMFCFPKSFARALGIHKAEKDGPINYWLQPKDYLEFRDNWKIIPSGF